MKRERPPSPIVIRRGPAFVPATAKRKYKTQTVCGIEGCGRAFYARRCCQLHYERTKRNGDPHVVKLVMSARGAARQWLIDQQTYSDSACLIWPFARHSDGRAHMNGDKPARVMCSLVNGPAPSDRHQAAHSCGKGHDGCVSPRHLRWATPAENAADKIMHGTVIVGDRHYATKLSEADLAALRSRLGTTTQTALATEYGICPSHVTKIKLGKRRAA